MAGFTVCTVIYSLLKSIKIWHLQRNYCTYVLIICTLIMNSALLQRVSHVDFTELQEKLISLIYNTRHT